MISIIIALLMALGAFFGVSQEASTAQSLQVTAEAAQVPTQNIACASVFSEQQDIDHALALVGDAFPSNAWHQTLNTSQEDKTIVTWTNDSLGALAYLELLHYDCGVTQQQIDLYYSPENFQIILSNYLSYQGTAQCQQNGLKLFEFDAVANGNIHYDVRYWVKQVSPTR